MLPPSDWRGESPRCLRSWRRRWGQDCEDTLWRSDGPRGSWSTDGNKNIYTYKLRKNIFCSPGSHKGREAPCVRRRGLSRRRESRPRGRGFCRTPGPGHSWSSPMRRTCDWSILSILSSDWSIYVILLSLPQQLLLLAHRAGDHLEELEENHYYPEVKKNMSV